MLWSLIRRLFGRQPAAPATPPSPTPSRVTPSPSRRPATSNSGQLMVIGARRPLVNVDGQISGFEFNLAGSLHPHADKATEEHVRHANLSALFASMHLCVQNGHFAFTELPAAWLPAEPSETAHGYQIALRALSDLPEPAALVAVLASWRRAGAVVGWRANEPDLPGLRADFVVSDTALPPTSARWVAPYLPDVDALESALRCGAGWAGSAVMVGAEPREAKALPPATRHLMRLLNQLIRDEDTHAVVNEIKGDAALSVRLLQHLNSAGMTRGTRLSSIEQAVSVLGRDALYHWVSGMLVRMGPVRPAAASLQARALWRGRMLEMMGRAARESEPGTLYLMGLTSVLPTLLHISMAEALASMQLPSMAAEALEYRRGPWAIYLELMEALEKPDMVAAQALAEPLGGLDAMMNMSASAWKAS